MSIFQQLPSEICQHIFDHVASNRASLQASMYVCKKWYDFTIIPFYKNIQIRGINIARLHTLFSTKTDLQPYFQYTPHTTTLTIYHDEHQQHTVKLSSKRFLDLLLYFPNLIKLDLSGSHHCDHYMKTILYANLPILSHIQQIDTDYSYWSDVYCSYYYLSVCQKYSHTLKQLYLLDEQQPYEPTHFNHITFLPHFSQLTNLTVFNYDNRSLTLFSVLTMCPQLTHVSYESSFCMNDIATYVLSRMNQRRPYHHRLISLVLRLPTLSEPYLDYLLYYTSSHMETIKLELVQDNFFNWIQKHGIQKIVALAKRMSLASHAMMYASSIHHTAHPVQQDYLSQVINALGHRRQLNYQYTLREYGHAPVLLEVTQNTMHLDYGLLLEQDRFDASVFHLNRIHQLELYGQSISVASIHAIVVQCPCLEYLEMDSMDQHCLFEIKRGVCIDIEDLAKNEFINHLVKSLSKVDIYPRVIQYQ
ncbi:uncharacterized protein B0P05DRAFT_563230 [Gilbertella persicaria]|uniref:uncharacterized protein n=1 Tax=Gilbertella persicaria TaxID=101096 RepID=UPI0022200E13|nr:uncharacterized protein B0P05DRAFT_563230 [Gilbertella persicaria]KAI8050138.1 hypothetical protein B0P05DRAFT_563230 [Gilbertella persicaria]